MALDYMDKGIYVLLHDGAYLPSGRYDLGVGYMDLGTLVKEFWARILG